MWGIIQRAFRSPEIRGKILFTLAILALYRFGAFIPAPGVNPQAVQDLASSFGDSSILSFLNLFSGGSLSRFAVFALGIMPYITASIVLQLLTVVVPTLEKLRREGEAGQVRITQYTRYLTVALAFAQSIGYVFLFRSFSTGNSEVIQNFSALKLVLVALVLTCGCVVVMWLGELITQRGIGNGISLMIFASIVTGLPGGVQQWYTSGDPVLRVAMPFVVLGVIAAVVFMQEGTRRIPIIYAKQVFGKVSRAQASSYLPLKVNMAGVIPVIFAASIMAMPPTVGELIQTEWASSMAAFFAPQSWAYVVGESFFIIIFAYFYTAVMFNPVEQADNLKKNAGYIPGIKPGRPTAEYLDRILTRLTLPGALYLATVAAFPTILLSQTSATFFFGGTSLLIVVGVALDTVKQLEAQVNARGYRSTTEQQLQL